MKRLFFLFVTIFFIVVFFANSSLADTPTPAPSSGPRYAVCDACGYCPPAPTPGTTPGNWASCLKCLYPSIAPDPNSMESLKVDPATNLPITPYPGHQYTFLGCLTTSAGSFSQPGGGGAGDVVQTLLKTVFSVVGGIAFLYFLYGSFILITSQNDPEKLNYGKRVVYGAIAGLIFSLTSVLLVNFLASQVLKIPGFSQ